MVCSSPSVVALSTFPKVIVIVAFKNEENSIHHTLRAVLGQNYPDYEVIAIDDHSTDNSYDVASHISDDRLLLLRNDSEPGKKNALTLAIAHADASYLLFTDADCEPASLQWIDSMMASMLSRDGVEIVLGVAPFSTNSGFVNLFARYENVMTAIQYVSYAVLGIPYMGVGRNLLYKKDYYSRIHGFESHGHISSGDDDLTVSAAADSANTVVNMDKNSFVYSKAASTFEAFIRQKTRHITTSIHYRWYHQLLLGGFGIAHLLWLPMILALFLTGQVDLGVILSIVVLKWSVQILLQHKFYRLLETTKLALWFPILDMCYSIYLWLLILYNPFRNKSWK